MLTQLSVFVENKFGRLAAVTETLQNNGIDISALSLADSSEFGILRLIVDKPELALTALKQAGIFVKKHKVIAANMSNTPGGLNTLLKCLTENNINIEYMYAYIDNEPGNARTVMQTDDNEKAEKVFAEKGIPVLTE